MFNMNNLKNIVLAVCIILLILIFSNKGFAIRFLGGYTVQNKVISIDSTFVKGNIDTLEIFNHYVENKGIILNPEPTIKYIYKDNDKKITKIDSVKSFKVAVNDSLITGNIDILNKFNGNLVSANLTYKPLFPKLITRIDTLKIHTKETILLENKTKFGLGFGINNHLTPSVLGGITFKNDYQVLYEFSHIKDLGNTHAIKIIKNF